MWAYRGAAVLVTCVLGACVGAPSTFVGKPMATTHGTTWTTGRPGFDINEARTLLEFCVALDYGHDLYKHGSTDPAVAEPDDAQTRNWREIFPARGVAVGDNPDPPNLGPYFNAWRLYQATDRPDVFAIVIRGTIDQRNSALEDIIATSTGAKVRFVAETGPERFIRFTLAQTPRAEVHLGFAYGLAAVMFDREYGILHVLQDGIDGQQLVPPGSKIYIAGHSQGAAIATLVHAFLHYAMVDDDPDEENPAYSLRGKNYHLKSYVFAQPKPGNWQFAMDFARIAGSEGAAFVINNDMDWVPQVPLALEFFDEPGEDLAVAQFQHENPVRQWFDRIFAGGAIGFLQGVRGIDSVVGEDITLSQYQNWFDKHPLPDLYLEAGTVADADRRGISINYALAGNLVPVFGSEADLKDIGFQAPEGQADMMWQHHATTYRMLLTRSEDKGGPPPCAIDPGRCRPDVALAGAP